MSKLDYSRFVYVIDTKGAVKVGIAGSPKQRLKQLATGAPLPLALAYELDCGQLAEAVEANVHKRLARFRLNGEWFHIISPPVIEVVKEEAATLGVPVKDLPHPRIFVRGTPWWQVLRSYNVAQGDLDSVSLMDQVNALRILPEDFYDLCNTEMNPESQLWQDWRELFAAIKGKHGEDIAGWMDVIAETPLVPAGGG
jgi:hypothetical protein